MSFLLVLCRNLNQAPKIREVDFSACSLTSQGAHIIADLIRVSLKAYLQFYLKTKTYTQSANQYKCKTFSLRIFKPIIVEYRIQIYKLTLKNQFFLDHI